jgi:hypothetical protein
MENAMPLPTATARGDAKQEEREQQRYENWLAGEYAEITVQEPFPLPAKCPRCGGLLPHIGGRCNKVP